MLTGGLDPMYRSILLRPHAQVCRVEVWSATARIDTYGDDGVPYQSGSVSATLTSRVARVLSLTLDRGLFPASPLDLLAPFGNYLKVYSGVNAGAGPAYMFPVFVGRINDCTLDNSGGFSLTAVDLAADVQDCYFGHPVQSNTTVDLAQNYKILVRQAVPTASFGTFDNNSTAATPSLTWQNDRAGACDDLANQNNMFWYPLADGSFVMRQVAWTAFQSPLLTLNDGANGGLMQWSLTYSRTNVYNSILVAGELSDGSTPVWGTAQDNNVNSPTYINGNFGQKTQYIAVQGTLTQGSATSLANAYLAQSTALIQTWTAQIAADASLELGDALQLLVSINTTQTRLSTVQIVTSFTLSLDSKDTMYVTMRQLVPTNVPQVQ